MQFMVVNIVILHSRYGDIIVIPDTGWFITSRSTNYSFIVVRSGEHGYDNNAKTMRVSSYHQLCDYDIISA